MTPSKRLVNCDKLYCPKLIQRKVSLMSVYQHFSTIVTIQDHIGSGFQRCRTFDIVCYRFWRHSTWNVESSRVSFFHRPPWILISSDHWFETIVFASNSLHLSSLQLVGLHANILLLQALPFFLDINKSKFLHYGSVETRFITKKTKN